MTKRLFILSNRLPITITEQGDVRPSNGGLATAVNSYASGGGAKPFDAIVWAGIPGCSAGTWRKLQDKLTNRSFSYLPVFTTQKKYNGYYNGFSNAVLWPLFHYFPSYADYNPEQYEQYQQVNQQFADTLLAELSPTDTVWIHDYHLLPLAALLRQALPELTIGFFLHIPFPSYELFRLLPNQWQEELLKGLLGADLIGFHTADYAAHFLKCLQMVLGIDHQQHVVQYDNRLIKIDRFPISIDFQAFNDAYDAPAVAGNRQLITEQFKGKKLIFSVDRLDYTKGIMNRLKAYRLFLKQNPQYAGQVVFTMILAPSRDTIAHYAERKKLIDEYVSRINSRMGTVAWVPVVYLYQQQSFENMMALYSACDLAMVTPLRDGMNLVAKEFVAARKDRKGVLLLSEMAGATDELTGAIKVNPNDVTDMARKIREGLEMPEAEQAERLEQMQNRIRAYDVRAWADDFMTRLADTKDKQGFFQVAFLDAVAKARLLDDYRMARKRLLLLDYDGTLVSFKKKPELAIPSEKLIALLKNLGEAEENDVYVISGRNRAWLEKYFGDLPLGLVAEHGANFKPAGGSWQTDPQMDDRWKDSVRAVMEEYSRRCDRTFVEEKEFSIVWHYRNANPEQGSLRAAELTAALNEQTGNGKLKVMMGNKIVEVRQSGVSKGSFTRKLVQQQAYDYIFAVGDDRTDEDMFKALMGKDGVYSIKVGTAASHARYNLHTPAMVGALLNSMSYLSLPVPER